MLGLLERCIQLNAQDVAGAGVFKQGKYPYS